MAAYQDLPSAKPEKIKELDSFHNELQVSSERFQKLLGRLENVAIRFRGHVPKPEEKTKDEAEPSHKIESLNRMSVRINQQLNQLDYFIVDLEGI